jgi:hypothetical protein
MKNLFKQIARLALLLAVLAAPATGLATTGEATVQPPAQVQLAWDRVGSPINPVG